MALSEVVKGALLFLLALAFCSSADSLTPLIAWSNSDALSTVKLQQSATVTSLLDQANLDGLKFLVVFKTDQLTFDDIVKYAGVYGEGHSALANLQSFVKGGRSSVWGGVDSYSASQLTDTLSVRLSLQPLTLGCDIIVTPRQRMQSMKSTDLIGSEKLTVDSESPRLLVVDLPSGSGEEGFMKQDSRIAEVMGRVSELNAPYIAFYTADGFVPWEESDVDRVRERRSIGGIRAVDSTSSDDSAVNVAIPNNSSYCLLFRFATSSIRLELENSNDTNCTVDVSSQSFQYGGCQCEQYNGFPCLQAQLEVTQSLCPALESAHLESLNLTFVFPNGANRSDILNGYWRMDIHADWGAENSTVFTRMHPDPNIYYKFAVPRGESYACSHNNSLNAYTIHHEQNSTDSVSSPIKAIHLPGLQVQAYGPFYVDKQHNPVFASAFNCQGYFTAASWMGVFSVFVLGLVFYVAIVFAFSIQTIDRFDDPRGPTITIENLH